MAGVLAIGESRSGELAPVSQELITLGSELAAQGLGPLVVALIAPATEAEELVPALAIEGVSEVVLVADPGGFDPVTRQRAVEGLIADLEPTLILLGHTVDSMGFAAALAAANGLGFASDVTRLALEDGAPIATRSLYGGKLDAELEFPGSERVVVTIRPGSYPPAAGEHGTAATRSLEIELGEPSCRHLDYVRGDAADVDITEAEFLLSVGRGIGEAENLEQFATLAENIGATLSVSRPIVDAGWISSANQVGQSGKTVSPKVYLALGISGAVQHLAGIGGAGTIIAVNTDPDAPIFNVAHYGAVADLFEVADELEEIAPARLKDKR